MNAYTKIAAHHAAHVFKKGAYMGDAPAGSRSMTHFRVIKHDHCYTVRMHNTDIMVVTPDGNVSIDCEGWADRPTTKLRLNEALGKFVSGWYLCSAVHRCYRQLVLRNMYTRTLYRYYDGVTLATDSTRQAVIVSELKTFQGRRVDKARVAAFMQDVADSGFKDAFKILHAVIDPHSIVQGAMPYVGIEVVLTDNQYAEYWPTVIARHAMIRAYDYPAGKYVTTVRDAKATWDRIMREVKKPMFETFDTGCTKAAL